jgi:hypothetical protein
MAITMIDPDATPIEVASQALRAHSAGDWHRLATLTDQESLRAWRDGFVRAHVYVPTLAELASEDPEVPAEALPQRREERIARCRHFEANLPRVVAGVRTAEELRALDPMDLFVCYVKAHDMVEQVGMLYREAYDAAALPMPHLDQSRVPLTIRATREEVTSETEARVVLREIGPDGESIGPEAQWMLRRQPGGPWRVLVTDDFLVLPAETSVMIDDPVVWKFLQG